MKKCALIIKVCLTTRVYGSYVIILGLFYRNRSFLLFDSNTKPQCDRAKLFFSRAIIDDECPPFSRVGDGAKGIEQTANKAITLLLPANKTFWCADVTVQHLIVFAVLQ